MEAFWWQLEAFWSGVYSHGKTLQELHELGVESWALASTLIFWQPESEIQATAYSQKGPLQIPFTGPIGPENRWIPLSVW